MALHPASRTRLSMMVLEQTRSWSMSMNHWMAELLNTLCWPGYAKGFLSSAARLVARPDSIFNSLCCILWGHMFVYVEQWCCLYCSHWRCVHVLSAGSDAITSTMYVYTNTYTLTHTHTHIHVYTNTQSVSQGQTHNVTWYYIFLSRENCCSTWTWNTCGWHACHFRLFQ